MEPVILDLYHSVSRSVVLCEYLMSHPFQVVHDEPSDTYFAYSDLTKKFYYQKPSNSKYNGVYVAEGLMSIARAKGLFRDQEAK